MPRKYLYAATLTALLLAAPSMAAAQSAVTRIPLPNNSTFPISEGVWVGDTLYLSGTLDSSVAKGTPGDTEAQTVNTLKAIEKSLEEQHLSLGDVVLMHAYLAGDPAKGGKMDFAGFMAGYSQFFGTKDQPNKPARSAMQVAALALPAALIEIEVVAVKSHGGSTMRAALGK
ncbi:MAG TPA: Rid family hydrolase [Acidobacteriaceae bacterium]|nr:Rid family hydrolase [Acidobacteriaceae bacterium]